MTLKSPSSCFCLSLTLAISFSGLVCGHAQPTVPVDLVTGRAQVSVPLTSIEDGRLSVPVSLSYNASGVKVSDGNSHAGLGWSLAAGGGVFRQVRGLPDDYNGNPDDANDLRRGWRYGTGTNRIAYQIHNFSQSSDASTATYTDEAADYTYLSNLAYNKDTEPDLFTFSAPGLSGGFVFDTNGDPKPVPYQDIKIEIAATLPIVTIKITKNDGTRYRFAASATMTQFTRHDAAGTSITQFTVKKNLYTKTTTFTTAWELGSIATPAGDSIGFEYMPQRYRNSIDYVAISSIYAPAPDTTWYYDQQMAISLLKKIESRSRKVEFAWSGGDDLIDVSVTDKTSSKVKNFNIYWADVLGSDNPSLERTTRRFLTSIYERGSCEMFPSYNFEYYGVTTSNTIPIPFNNPKVKTDIWGYFNNNATNNNPTVYYYSGQTGSNRYRFYEIPGQSYTKKINGGSDRSVNPSTVMYGSLKKIKYPTGGMAEIVYEPNAYHDAVANATKYGPGIRVKQVITKDSVGNAPNTEIDYEYKMSDNTSSGKWTYRSAFAYHDVDTLHATDTRDNSPEPQIMYERVTVSQNGRGKVVTEFLLPGMDPITSYASGDFTNWTAARTYIARSINDAVSGLKSDFYQVPFAPNVNYDFQRGLVSKVSSYNSSNALIHEKTYQYQSLATTSVVVKGLRYELFSNSSAIDAAGFKMMYAFSHYPVLANAGRVVLTETERVADMNDVNKWFETSTSYTFNSTHHMLSTMSVTNSDGVERRTKFRYAKDYATLTQPSVSNDNAKMLKKLNDDFMHSAPVATISSVYSGSETVTGASLTTYGSFPDSLGKVRVLPVETLVTEGMSGWAEPAVNPPTGSGQVLQTNGTYSITSKVEQYDYQATPLTVRSRGKIVNGVHMGHIRTLPVAMISNAAANEVVFDDFESYTGFGFKGTHPHPPLPQFTFPAGWSGKKGLGMHANASINASFVKASTSKYYRYTIRVSGSNNTNISFRVFNGATEVVTAVVNHNTGNNDWKFYQGRINLTSAPDTGLTLKLENNTTVTVDDVTFYPESASVSTSTYEPVFGKTSETDTRGVSVFYEYDDVGRVRELRDQDKTLRQHTDYYYKVLPFPKLPTDFTPTTNPLVAVGQQVTYTAPPPGCLTGLSFDWYVDGVKLANDVSTFQYTFTQLKTYYVKMVTEHVTYGTASRQIEVDAAAVGTGPVSANVSATLIYSNCDPTFNHQFVATLSGCYLPTDVSINWYYKTGGSTWTAVSGPVGATSVDGKTLTFYPLVAFNGLANLNDYQVKFEVQAQCPLDTGSSFGKVYTDSEEKSIDYQYNPNCQ